MSTMAAYPNMLSGKDNYGGRSRMTVQNGPILQHLGRLRLCVGVLVAIAIGIIVAARGPMIDRWCCLSSRSFSARALIPARPH